MYAFLFDRKSLALVVVGLVLAGFLLFGAGIVVGAHLFGDQAWNSRPRPLSRAFAELPALPEPAGPGGDEAAAATTRPAGDVPRTPPVSPPPVREQPNTEDLTALPSEPAAGAAGPPEMIPAENASAETEEVQPAAGAGAQGSVYSVQAGAFRDMESAQERAGLLEKGGYKAQVKIQRSEYGTLFYKVRVGHYATYSEARAEAARIEEWIVQQAQEAFEALVVRSEIPR